MVLAEGRIASKPGLVAADGCLLVRGENRQDMLLERTGEMTKTTTIREGWPRPRTGMKGICETENAAEKKPKAAN